MSQPEVVEIERNGSTQPALVAGRDRLEADGVVCERVHLIIKDDLDGRRIPVETSADRVSAVSGSEADLARSLLADGLEVMG